MGYWQNCVLSPRMGGSYNRGGGLAVLALPLHGDWAVIASVARWVWQRKVWQLECSIRRDESPHGRTGSPGFPHRRRFHPAGGGRGDDCYARSRVAGDLAWVELVGRGVYLGAPPDGSHEA